MEIYSIHRIRVKSSNLSYYLRVLIFLISGKHSLSMSVRGRQDLEIQGPRLNNTKEEKTSVKYGPDRRLDPIVTEEMPLLEVSYFFPCHGHDDLQSQMMFQRS